jgi:hypothetical protein
MGLSVQDQLRTMESSRVEEGRSATKNSQLLKASTPKREKSRRLGEPVPLPVTLPVVAPLIIAVATWAGVAVGFFAK